MTLDHPHAYLAGDADVRFQKALAGDLTSWPFQKARLLLAQGEYLRRTRRTSEARVPLREAQRSLGKRRPRPELAPVIGGGRAGRRTARRIGRFGELSARFGERFLGLEPDVRDTDSAGAVVERAVASFGRIDVLLNNAGAGQVGAAEEISDARLRDMLDQHLFGPAAYVRAGCSLAPMLRCGCPSARKPCATSPARTSAR